VIVPWYDAALLMLGLSVVLMTIGLPVAIAFIATNLVGAYLFMGGLIGLEQVASNTMQSISSFLLVPVPLFILMGDLFVHTGLANRVFDALEKLFGRLPGRLCYVSVAGGTIFAALSGSAMASTAMLGSTMVPEMLRRGYKRYMAMGPILGAGGLAILIPPSALAVLLGSLADIDISALLIGGILPGLILAAAYAVAVYLQVRIDPAAAPAYAYESVSWRDKLALVVVNVLPMGLVVFAVVGLIILGIATPTESAAFGVLSVIILAVCFRCLTWQAIRKSLEGTLRVSVMVFTIIMGSLTFSQVLAFSGATQGLVNWALGFQVSTTLVLFIMFAIVVFLGLFIDEVSQMMLTIPIYMPIVKALGVDPVWYGVIFMMAMVLGALTPPFGLQLFVMMGVGPKGTTLGEVSWAAAPYMGCQLLVAALIFVFPPLALYLPALMR
jgi:tripartite ATP-independent transporter DctM subunit